MRALLDHLIQQGLLARAADGWALRGPIAAHALGVPESLRQMIEAQIARLGPEEQRVLEVASVTGAVFTASVGATAADWEAEVCRLRGVLLLRQPETPQAEAEAWLQRALDVARRQQAKALELRTAMSLARLWQQQDKRADAHALLAPLYGWFTEGFDKGDLQEAKALLETLA